MSSKNSFHEQRHGRIAVAMNSKERSESVDFRVSRLDRKGMNGGRAGNEITQFCLWLLASFYLTQGVGGLWAGLNREGVGIECGSDKRGRRALVWSWLAVPGS